MAPSNEQPHAGPANHAKKVIVGVGEFGVSNNPNTMLVTYSLGSCLAVSIYDPVARAGGLLHAMLPNSSINTAKALQCPTMFMDTGLPILFREAYKLKAEKYRVQICTAGGAQVMDYGEFFNIGHRNYATLIAILTANGLKLQAEAVGGLVNRTMTLCLATGEVRLRIGQAEEITLFKG